MPLTQADWIVVSGGVGSLGALLVSHYAQNGHRVLALDRAEAVGSVASTVTYRQLELTSPEAVQAQLAESIPRGERIGLLVNAVGLIWNEPVVALKGAALRAHGLDSWRQVIDANLTAPFVVAGQVAVRMARSGGGAIINFSSISGRGNAGQAAYSAAKAGVEGLTRAMAAELGPLGIRVNAIAPGFFDVPSTRAHVSGEQLGHLEERTPLRRLGSATDLLSAVDFLATSAFVTGVVLDVNGGLRL